MKTIKENIEEDLKLFNIPENQNTDEGKEIRDILARLLATGAIDMGNLLLIRDLVNEYKLQQNAYLFIAAMFLSRKAGNTFMYAKDIEELLKNGCYMDKETREAMGFDSNADIPATNEKDIEGVLTKVPPIIKDNEEDVKTALSKVSPIIKDKDGFYFQRDWDAVQTINKKLSKRLPPSGQQEDIGDVTCYANFEANGNTFELGKEQKDAVKKAYDNRFLVITGGPGTGKTTIVCYILRMLFYEKILKSTDEVALAAPTGRAAQRMGEALKKQCFSGLTGTTIHRLLGGLAPNFQHNAKNRLDKKLIIIDEVSMVDISLMQALLEALDKDSRLILLGDKDQLPSVEAGAVLGDIVTNDSGKGYIVRLTETHRFKGVLRNAAEIINNDDDKNKKIKGLEEYQTDIAKNNGNKSNDNVPFEEIASASIENCQFRHYIADGSPEQLQDRLEKWAKYFGLLDDDGDLVKLAKEVSNDWGKPENKNKNKITNLFNELDKSKILAVVRNGPFGVQGINRFLFKKRFEGKRINMSNALQEVGVPVIITENTPARNLFNGDIGITVKTGSWTSAIFPRGEDVVVCPTALLPAHDIAYAITIHKSQGSEFDNVLVILPTDTKNPLLNRSLIYTGITRAKKCAIVYGTDGAFKQAVCTKVKRNTGIH